MVFNPSDYASADAFGQSSPSHVTAARIRRKAAFEPASLGCSHYPVRWVALPLGVSGGLEAPCLLDEARGRERRTNAPRPLGRNGPLDHMGHETTWVMGPYGTWEHIFSYGKVCCHLASVKGRGGRQRAHIRNQVKQGEAERTSCMVCSSRALHPRPALVAHRAALRAGYPKLYVEPTVSSALLAADALPSDLDALGSDCLVFLAASVFVVPLSRYLNITPVLGFLALGCAIGPYGLSLFSDSEADIELGDFGILFLLFVEGLNLSPERIRKLGSFFSLGAAQLLVSIAVIFFGTLLGGPLLLPLTEQLVPLDDALIRPLLQRPVEAFTVAAAGALSSSAFVLPVLKQKGWERTADGTAALSILLLQVHALSRACMHTHAHDRRTPHPAAAGFGVTRLSTLTSHLSPPTSHLSTLHPSLSTLHSPLSTLNPRLNSPRCRTLPCRWAHAHTRTRAQCAHAHTCMHMSGYMAGPRGGSAARPAAHCGRKRAYRRTGTSQVSESVSQ